MKKNVKGPLIYIVIIAMLLLLSGPSFGLFGEDPEKKDISYHEFLDMVKKEEVDTVCLINYDLYGLKKGSAIKLEDLSTKKFDFKTYIPSIDQFNKDMKTIYGDVDTSEYGIKVIYREPQNNTWIISLISYGIPMILLVIFFVMMYRQSNGGGKAMNFGKSKAKMTTGKENNKSFADVAGADEEKEELKEIVDFLKNPRQFSALGARIPKGVLLVGPPGGGKTLLAKAVAGEAGVPFFSISGSDFVEMFVGVGASRVRDLFDNAKKNAPSIVFIDEIDAVGRHRGAGLGGGHDEREQTLNQLLVEMDGFQVNEGVIVMAATNRKDILDPALLRPGRFDRQIVINYPDIKGREEILKVHAKGKPLAPDVDLAVLAKRTPGFIGADLENVLNEAAILAARRKKLLIGMDEVEEAITRVIAGPEKKSRVVSEEDKKCTAYHEVGHAICAKVLPGCDDVHEVSIIPRGMAAGYTLTLPKDNNQHMFKSKMLDEIVMMLGGRAAEELVLGDISTGASNDIQRSTEIARKMVVNFGMSEEVGPIFLGGEEEVFLGKSYGHPNNLSEQVASKIDAEISRIMNGAYARAKEILSENMDKLHEISKTLIEKEKIDGEEFAALFEGREVQKKPEPMKRGTISSADFNKPEEQAAENLSEEKPAEVEEVVSEEPQENVKTDE